MLVQKNCPVCNALFLTGSNPKYAAPTCSRACSSIFYSRRKSPKTFICFNCKKEAPQNYIGSLKFCSVTCDKDFHLKEVIERFEKGLIRHRSTLRVHLRRSMGDKCNVCGIIEWNKKPITFQVNHKDGNCTNNLPSNLELICPNCHSQTDTFSGKNKGSGRKSRGLPLHY
jgi:hypothetical protein